MVADSSAKAVKRCWVEVFLLKLANVAVPSGEVWKGRAGRKSDGWFLFMVGSASHVFNVRMRGEEN